MHPIDLILIALLAAGVFLALRSAWRHRGGCGGDCAHCASRCSHADNEKK